jgi:hypothetical protein
MQILVRKFDENKVIKYSQIKNGLKLKFVSFYFKVNLSRKRHEGTKGEWRHKSIESQPWC